MTTMISRLFFVRKNVRTAWAAFLAGLLLSSSITSAQWSENAVIEWKAPPDNWELIGYSPVFEDAVWAGEQYLAITSSFVSRSSDGRVWEHQTMTSDFSLNAIETGAGRTVVVGTFGGIAHSTDGVTWQRVGTGDTGTFHGVAFGNGLWLAVGPGIIFTSPNGVDWTQRSFSSPSPGGMGVAFGNGIFVTVGNDASFTTVDAEAWQSHSAPAFGGNDVEALTFLNDAFFAATEEAVFRSTDGTAWEQVLETEPELSVKNFTLARGRYLGVGAGTIYSSVDGRTWGHDMIPRIGSNEGRGIAASEDHLVVLGRNTILRSDLHHPLRRFGAIAFGDGRFVAVGSNGRAVVSNDGVTWSETPAVAVDSLWDIRYGGDRFVAVGSNGAIVTTLDGENWQRQESAATGFLHGVVYGDDRYVAVGRDRTVVYSNDGELWETGTVNGEMPPTASLLGVAYGAGAYVAVGHDGTILRSLDGISWEVASRNRGDRLGGVAYGNGRFVAVGMRGLVLVSSTGEEWRRAPLDSPVDLSRVRFIDSTFVATGWRGEVLLSPDGDEWTVEQTTETKFLADVAAGDGKLVAVGLEGAILGSSAPPVIHQNPSHQTVSVGENVLLEVSAEGSGELSYQWYRDGGPMAGATSPVYTIAGGARLSDDGVYQVAIDDGNRIIWSRPARLTVEGDYADWLAESDYSEAELEQPELSSPTADPGGYGIPNLLRHVLQLDPHSPDPRRLPALEMRPVSDYGDSGQELVFKIQRLRGAKDVALTVQQSGDLVNWSDRPLDSFDVVAEDGHDLLILRSPVSASAGSDAFFRLQGKVIE